MAKGKYLVFILAFIMGSAQLGMTESALTRNPFDEEAEITDNFPGISTLFPSHVRTMPPRSTRITYRFTWYTQVGGCTEVRIPKAADVEVSAIVPDYWEASGTELGSEVVVFSTDYPEDEEVWFALTVNQVNAPVKHTPIGMVVDGEKKLDARASEVAGNDTRFESLTFASQYNGIDLEEIAKLDDKLCEAIRLLLTPEGRRGTACCEEMVFPEGKDVPGYCGDVPTDTDEDSDEEGNAAIPDSQVSPEVPHRGIRTLGRL